LQDLKRALENNPDVAQVARDFNLVSPSEQQHLENDWFSDGPDGWWKRAQPVAPIIREGFIVAIGEALDNGVPLDCYWICYSKAGEGCCRNIVEFFCGVNERQVTVMIHTPGAEVLSIPRPPHTETEPIWVISRDEQNNIVPFRPTYARTPDYVPGVPLPQ
jgi:hypothetical protein